MFEAWGRGLYRARRLTLLIALLFAIGAGVWGTGVFGKLDSGNTFTPPNSQSNVESNLAASLFGRDDADVVVLFHSAADTVADPAYRQAVTAYLAALPADQVTKSATYWTSGQPDLVSGDKHSTYAVLQLAGGTDQAREDTYKAIKADFPATAGPAGDGITARSAAPRPPKSPSTARSAPASPGPSRSRSRCCSSCWCSSSAAWSPPACRSRSAASPSSARSPCSA